MPPRPGFSPVPGPQHRPPLIAWQSPYRFRSPYLSDPESIFSARLDRPHPEHRLPMGKLRMISGVSGSGGSVRHSAMYFGSR